MNSLLSGLVSSNIRIRLLVRLFANPDTTGYLRGLTEDFGLSSNAVREELNRLSKAKRLAEYGPARPDEAQSPGPGLGPEPGAAEADLW